MTKSIWYLEEVDLFHIICPHKYNDFCEVHPLDCYNKSDFLFFPDDLSQDIYLIASGKVKVGYYDDQGKEYIKAILGKGELLGEKAFLGESRHRDFAEIIQNKTHICKLTVEKAQELARSHRPFSLEIYKRIGMRFRQIERRLEILLFKDARQRLEEFIKDLAAYQGKEQEHGILIEHDLTQSDIANLIGTSRKTVSLLMNELEDQMQIEFSRKQIFIPDMGQLLVS
jgi:CRP-like cAMP-binding protein